jgi:hypothetical protein
VTVEEDQRTASGFVVTLSGYVMTAALAVLGAQAVVATFAMDRREHLGFFYAASALGAAALVSSIVVGGKGISEIIARGWAGDWQVRTRRGMFKLQSWLALAGAALVVLSAFLGDTKPAA